MECLIRGLLDVPHKEYRWRCHLLTLPGDTNFTIHTKVHVAAREASSRLAIGGIVLSDTNTTNTGTQTGASFGWTDLLMPGATTNGWSNFGETAAGATSSLTHRIGGRECHIRVRKNSGSWFAAWSEDGETWYEVALTIVGGITPAYFGLYGLNYTNTGNARFSFPYLRYYANGTQYRTGSAVDVLG